ncbi:hypothetical protein L596_009255 [Steinernema carpocapsae]|uniref:Uncharacterized protein n=1 Tax=Steinernema carpocapsae TaxID=34508 RepID=A0A4U5PEU8_STECR|nr:hypothetical protein L596_009255 [Steinernema carpocapsae]
MMSDALCMRSAAPGAFIGTQIAADSLDRQQLVADSLDRRETRDNSFVSRGSGRIFPRKWSRRSSSPLHSPLLLVHDVPFCAQNEPRESFLVSLDFTLENEGTTSLNFHFTNSDEAMAPGVHLSFSYSSWKDENRTIEAFFTGFNLSVSSQIRAVVDFQNRTLSYQSYPKTLVFKHFVLPPAANGSFYNGQRVSVKTNSESGVCVGFFQILEIPAGLNTAMEILGHNPLSPPVQLPRSRRNWRQRKKPISAGSYFWPFFLAAVIYGTVGIIINWYVKKTRSAQVIRELDTQVRKDVAMDSERD